MCAMLNNLPCIRFTSLKLPRLKYPLDALFLIFLSSFSDHGGCAPVALDVFLSFSVNEFIPSSANNILYALQTAGSPSPNGAPFGGTCVNPEDYIPCCPLIFKAIYIYILFIFFKNIIYIRWQNYH